MTNKELNLLKRCSNFLMLIPTSGNAAHAAGFSAYSDDIKKALRINKSVIDCFDRDNGDGFSEACELSEELRRFVVGIFAKNGLSIPPALW